MPKPRVQTARRPPCPNGHQGEVWLDGFYARDGKHKRPRFRCVPRVDAGTGKRPPFHSNGDKAHTFIEPLARRHPTTGNGAAHFCEECEHTLDRYEGPQTTRRQTFTIREAAQAVIQVAKGTSMRRASRDARESADRLAMTTWAGMRPSPQGQLASDQLAMFGTMVRDVLIPRPWPDSVALDETSFDVVITDKTATGKVSSPGTVSVLGVYGYGGPDERASRPGHHPTRAARERRPSEARAPLARRSRVVLALRRHSWRECPTRPEAGAERPGPGRSAGTAQIRWATTCAEATEGGDEARAVLALTATNRRTRRASPAGRPRPSSSRETACAE